ncbi:hypothetical protein BS78_10G221700 [Paspalum vaginatum]|nr:hypothetical protein BS78_10G221700 [Paspalum vaginatum]
MTGRTRGRGRLPMQSKGRVDNRDAYEYVQTQRGRQRLGQRRQRRHEGEQGPCRCRLAVQCLTTSVHGCRSRALVSSRLSPSLNLLPPQHKPKKPAAAGLRSSSCQLLALLRVVVSIAFWAPRIRSGKSTLVGLLV